LRTHQTDPEIAAKIFGWKIELIGGVTILSNEDPFYSTMLGSSGTLLKPIPLDVPVSQNERHFYHKLLCE